MAAGLPRPVVVATMSCLGLVLSACTTLGPDFEEPEAAWLERWQPDLYGQLGDADTETSLDLRFWWHLFDDDVLNGLIVEARQRSPSLRIAGLRMLESRAALGIAGSDRYPQLQQIGAAATRLDTHQDGGAIGDDSQSFTRYEAGFRLGWELDFWGRFRRNIESADAAFLASIAQQRDAQVLLSAQVAELYFSYRTTAQRIDIARENADIQRRSYAIAERQYLSGEKDELDLQQAKTQYLATLGTIPVLEREQVATRNALCALLARPPAELPELSGSPGPLPTLPTLASGGLPARLILRRPDVRAAAWQVAAQSAQIGVAAADYYPTIALTGSIAWSHDSASASPDVRGLSAGPALSWNIFDHGRIANNVRLQDARLQVAIESFQQRALQAAQEVDNAAIAVAKSQELRAVLSESVRAAKRSLQIANTLYREGYAEFNRVLDAQRALFAQSEQQLVNEANHLSAVIALYKALGGGWLESSLDDALPDDVRTALEARGRWGTLLDEPLPIDTVSSPTR